MNLRQIIAMAAATLLAAGTICAQTSSENISGSVDQPSGSHAPRYIFYFIGDGMGFNHVVNAQIYRNEVLGVDSTLTMLSMPVTSAARTHSASSDVTDSAAAGTALATGHKTRNNMLGMSADTVAVTSIAKTLFDRGWGIGLVTSVGIDDATPGAFYAHVPSRYDKMDVARQLAGSGYQFAAGAGLAAARDEDGRLTGLLDYFTEQGVKVAYGPEGLEEEADRLLVLSRDTMMTWNVGYTVDSIPGALTLPAMTAAGIRHLQRVSPDRFFMMVEGGNIDHAGHANDGGTIIREVLNFDQAISLAWNFYEAHPDETLIVITADHETGGMSIGNTFTGYNVYPSKAAGQKISKERFSNYVKSLAHDRRIYRWEDMEEYLRDNLGWGVDVIISEEENNSLKEMFEEMMAGRNSAPDQETLYATFDGFSARVFELLNREAGYGFATIKHTGAPVPVFAAGVGACRFSSLNDNSDLPRKILSIALGEPASTSSCRKTECRDR